MKIGREKDADREATYSWMIDFASSMFVESGNGLTERKPKQNKVCMKW